MSRSPQPPVLSPPPSADFDLTESGDFKVSEYIDVLRRQWRLIALGVILGVAAGALQYFNTPESYQARTRIQIQKRSPSPFGQQNSYWAGGWYNPEFYPTQHEILKSRGLAMEVVRQQRLWEEPYFGGSLDQTAPEGVAGTAAADEAALGRLADAVRSRLEVREVGGTQLADIIYHASDPRIAMRVANAYADAFIEYGKTERRSAASNASDFLNKEIAALQEEIRSKEVRLQEYSRDQDIVAVDPQSNVALQQLEAANSAYNSARSRRIEAEVAYNQVLQAPQETIADSLSGGLVSTLRTELLTRERDYRTKLQTYRPQTPVMTRLRAEIEADRKSLDELIAEKVEAAREKALGDYQTARRTEENLEAELNKTKGELLRFNSATIEYNNLQLEVGGRRELLADLQRTQSEAGVALKGADEATVRQIDPALLPLAPTAPDLKNNLTKGAGLGLFLGIGLVFFLEFLDRSIKTPEELERRLGLPTLAVVPDISSAGRRYGYLSRNAYGGYGYGYARRRNNSRRRADGQELKVDLIPHQRPRLAVSEAYRSLRTALLLSSAEELRVVVVTSATAGEGKTATAANLATVMAQLGRRVLLIDADLRKPRVHEVFGVSNRSGLVNYLVGRAELENAIVESKVDNLYVCPAGPIPPNPSELLSSDRMRHLVARMRERFDFVIIDTPPTLAVTDSTLMGHRADGVVLCVRAGHSPREETVACRDRLLMADVRVLGTVLNCHRPLHGLRSERSYSYHYEAYGDESSVNEDPTNAVA